MGQRIYVAAVVINEGKLLVIRRVKPGEEYFTFPGGGLEEGETLEAGTLRELSEETCIEATVDRLLYKITWNTGNVNHYFLCTYISGEPTLRPDAPEIARMADGTQVYEPMWLPLSDVPNTILYPLEIRDEILSGQTKGYPAEIKEIHITYGEQRKW